MVLEIAPGGGQALEDLERTVQRATEQLTTSLKALGAASVEAAEALLEQRTGLEQQLAGLVAAATADLGQLEQQKDALEQRLVELDADLEELADVRQALEQEQPVPQALSELQALQQQIGEPQTHRVRRMTPPSTNWRPPVRVSAVPAAASRRGRPAGGGTR